MDETGFGFQRLFSGYLRVQPEVRSRAEARPVTGRPGPTGGEATLEQYPSPQFDLARRTGTADGSEGGCAERLPGESQVGMVQSIKEFAAEFRPYPLGNTEIAEQREIQVHEPGSPHDSHALVAECVRRRLGKYRGIEPHSHAALAGGQVGVTQHSGPLRPRRETVAVV